MNAFDQHVMILATGPKGELGLNGGFPWPHLPADMKFFNRITKGRTRNAIVMGRKTWQSLPVKALAKRRNIVVSRDPDARAKYAIPADVVVVGSFAECKAHMDGMDMCFVCGGAQLYAASRDSGKCRAVYHTLIEGPEPLEADNFFTYPVELHQQRRTEVLDEVREKGFRLQFRLFDLGRSPETDEQEYIRLLQRILTKGKERGDRTGVGTVSVFGAQLRFDLRDGRMPLITSKTTLWRSLAIELLWFISGSTSAKELAACGVHIWDANGSREFLDGRGLKAREEGDLGPVYGFQWRHHGAEYVDMHADYTGRGVDQLAEVIRLIREEPTSRRIVMCAWNPDVLDQMALPPCHMFCQFYVQDGELSCSVYCRSQDTALGTPFNVASYALLTHIIAHCCDLKAAELVLSMGDAHIYSNHVDSIKRQLTRGTFEFPRIIVDADTRDIDEIEYKHLKLRNYACFPPIQMQMAV